MKRIFTLFMQAFILICLAVSCTEKELEIDLDYETSEGISSAEFETNVCGYGWKCTKCRVIHTDDSKYALPFYEDEYLDRLYFDDQGEFVCLCTQIYRNMYYKNKYQYDPIAKYVCLEDGTRLMRIVSVTEDEMKVLLGVGIKDGQHRYAISTYRKMTDAEWKQTMESSGSYREFYHLFAFEESGMPYCMSGNAYRQSLGTCILTPDYISKYFVGHYWRGGNYQNYEILPDGMMRQETYPYGHESGSRFSFYFHSDSILTVYETPEENKESVIEHTYPFTFTLADGRNDIVYFDELRNRNCTIRITYVAFFTECFRAILDINDQYTYCAFDRESEYSIEEMKGFLATADSSLVNRIPQDMKDAVINY